jgi:carbohydrate-binding DOMON domain-containing protein
MKRLPWILILTALLLASGAAFAFEPIVFEDPAGDDKGPGTYKYPTAAAYKSGSFDLKKVEIKESGDNVEFKVTFKARIEDPWDSKSWSPPGQGFSLQFVQIYIDTDRKEGSGHKDALPGINIRFPEQSRWEKVVLLSPQPVSRLKMELKMKAKAFAKSAVVPKKVRVKGKSLIVTVPKSELGDVQKSWGWQVVVQSNEGYPDGNDVLTRDVNEIEGEHRFGGGNDWDCDPHSLDILAGQGKGKDGEKQAQFDALKYKCAGSDLSKAKLAEVPMIYPQ